MQDPNEIVFEYTPCQWDPVRFQTEWGGYCAVVLNYNKGILIRDAILSAFKQNYHFPYEILIFDDASIDGSKEIVLKTVKEFLANTECQQKVRVIFNSINKSITRQWNAAVHLSNALWFGMFCGDDIALPDRISIIDMNVRLHPTVWAICTNMYDGNNDSFVEAENNVFIWRGSDEIIERSIHGCTAFYHRDLLEGHPLPKCNIDDWLLKWCIFIRCQGMDRECIAWDMMHATIRYSIGTGITTKFLDEPSKETRPFWRAMKMTEAYMSHWQKYEKPVWNAIRMYDESYGKPGKVRDYISGCLLLAKMRTSGWFGRISTFLVLNILYRKKSFGGGRHYVVKQANKWFFNYFFGKIGYSLIYMLKRVLCH